MIGAKYISFFHKCYDEDMTNSERRMAENEVVFRQYNESIQDGIDQLTKMALEDGQESHIMAQDMPLHFYCECSDENCTQRIKLTPASYTAIHKKRDHFIIVHGHKSETIERVISVTQDFDIVEKFLMPPESASGLQRTDADNS